MDERKFKAQKKFEQELARQGKRIEAQARLLEDLNDALWEFQLLALQPAHYRLQGNLATGETASKSYREQAVVALNKIRAQIGKSRSLASPEMHQKLVVTYGELLARLDSWLTKLEQNESTVQDWQDYHEFAVKEVVSQIEDLLNLLAWDFGLAAPKAETKLVVVESRPG